MRQSRRAALRSAFAAFSAVGLAASGFAAPTAAGRLFVPGYRVGEARVGAQWIADLPGVAKLPPDWEGRRTLLSTLDLGDPLAEPVRAVLPVRGHSIVLPSGTGPAVFVGMESQTTLAFDPETLEPQVLMMPAAEGRTFGGHGVRLPDGRHIAVVERVLGDSTSDKETLGGWIVIRDASTLQPVNEMPSYGIRPHEIKLTDDGRHLVVANYGSVAEAGDGPEDYYAAPRVVAPAIAVIELATGRLVARISGAKPEDELRHLVAPNLQRIFAIAARLDRAGGPDGSSERYPDVADGLDYYPAAPVRVAEGAAVPLLKERPELARQGISLGYDAAADAILMTFPSSHSVVVFDGATGATRKIIDAAALGLRLPCGITQTPDRRHWLVAGYWRGLLTLRAGSLLVDSVSPEPQWWGHSHIAAG
jgi:hypothetical protein